MLVLSRRENEEIVIDERITVTVIEVSRGRVKLGLNSPGMRVRRGEVSPEAYNGLTQRREPAPERGQP